MKASSSNPIIREEEAPSWQPWQPADLAQSGRTKPQLLTPEQAAALTAFVGGTGSPPAAQPDSPSATPEPADPPAEREMPTEPDLPPPAYPTAAELEAIHQEAWQAGFEAGQAAGLAEGQSAGFEAARAEAMQQFSTVWAPAETLARSFAEAVSQMEPLLAEDLLRVAVTLAEKLLMTQLQVDPQALLPVLRQALGELPGVLASARVRAHPDDVQLLRDFLQQEAPQTVWQWQEDPAISRGGCIIDAPFTHLDLTISSRLKALFEVLGQTDTHDAERPA